MLKCDCARKVFYQNLTHVFLIDFLHWQVSLNQFDQFRRCVQDFYRGHRQDWEKWWCRNWLVFLFGCIKFGLAGVSKISSLKTNLDVGQNWNFQFDDHMQLMPMFLQSENERYVRRENYTCSLLFKAWPQTNWCWTWGLNWITQPVIRGISGQRERGRREREGEREREREREKWSSEQEEECFFFLLSFAKTDDPVLSAVKQNIYFPAPARKIWEKHGTDFLNNFASGFASNRNNLWVPFLLEQTFCTAQGSRPWSHCQNRFTPYHTNAAHWTSLTNIKQKKIEMVQHGCDLKHPGSRSISVRNDRNQ